jgi:hypothetical protein
MNAQATEQSGYYAPLTETQSHAYKAWTVRIGQTPDGAWVAEYQSKAMPRYERRYFSTEAEAEQDAKWIIVPKDYSA